MRFIVLALLAAVAVTPAVAQTPAAPATSPAPAATSNPAPAGRAARHPRMTMQKRFDAANTTHDGKLTLDQAKAANLHRVIDNFTAMDTAKKGYVTVDDWHAFNRSQRAARRAAKPKAATE